MANELRVRANFLGGLTEDNPLASGATVLTSAGLASLPAIGSTQHMVLILDPDGVGGNPEIIYVVAHTAAATAATILRGQESTVARAHARDTPWIHGPTVVDFAAPPKLAHARRTSGTVVNPGITGVWTAIDTALDLSLTGMSAGDWIEVSLNARTYTSTPASNALYLTVFSMVSGAAVNDLATGTTPVNTTTGVGSWAEQGSVVGKVGSPLLYELQANDLSAGALSLRLMGKCAANANSQQLYATTDSPLVFAVVAVR